MLGILAKEVHDGNILEYGLRMTLSLLPVPGLWWPVAAANHRGATAEQPARESAYTTSLGHED